MKVQEVNPVEGLSVSVIPKFLPPVEELPKEFWNNSSPLAQKWATVAAEWFYFGLKNAQWKPKEGVDISKAIRHIGMVLGSFEPKHEHKIASTLSTSF